MGTKTKQQDSVTPDERGGVAAVALTHGIGAAPVWVHTFVNIQVYASPLRVGFSTAASHSLLQCQPLPAKHIVCFLTLIKFVCNRFGLFKMGPSTR